MRFITDWLIHVSLNLLCNSKQNFQHFFNQVWPVNLFYQIGVGPDMRNTSSNILTVGPPCISFNPPFFIKITPNNVFLMSEKLYLEENLAPKYIPALKTYLAQIMELLYHDDSNQTIFKLSNKEADIQRRVDSFIQVEVEMAKVQRKYIYIFF
jgi:hypothetical protein